MRFERTKDFKKAFKTMLKKYPTINDDLRNLLYKLRENPFEGESLGDNTYKVRMAISAKGKGKSGGARVITCVKIIDDTIHLLTIYDKSEIENVSKEYLDELRKSIE
jgi:hypothetical protein